MAVKTIISMESMRELRQSWDQEHQVVGFIPTMGALHEGHLTLVKKAKEKAKKVIVSIFVNPTQFGANEDFATYPRMLKEDIQKLESLEIDAVFLPNTADLYPEGFQTYVANQKMANVLCGFYRPGHFQGVLTIVTKLFNLIQPHVALFGKKDYQQFRIIRKMVYDLNIPVEVIGEETVREADGLAMSSRNLRLTEEERKVAPKLYQGLELVQRLYAQGERNPEKLTNKFKQNLPLENFELQYAEIRDQENLQEFSGKIDKPAVLAVAAFLGQVRLIDNVELG